MPEELIGGDSLYNPEYRAAQQRLRARSEEAVRRAEEAAEEPLPEVRVVVVDLPGRDLQYRRPHGVTVLPYHIAAAVRVQGQYTHAAGMMHHLAQSLLAVAKLNLVQGHTHDDAGIFQFTAESLLCQFHICLFPAAGETVILLTLIEFT